MNKDTVILIAEDDMGHLDLVKRNLRRAGIDNETIEFPDGQGILDFFEKGFYKNNKSYILILDIRMPKVDGIEVLRRLKRNDDTKVMPVIMLTTTDDPRDIDLCHRIGCNNYITKPIDYDAFVKTIQDLGAFLGITKIPDFKQN